MNGTKYKDIYVFLFVQMLMDWTLLLLNNEITSQNSVYVQFLPEIHDQQSTQ